MEYENKTKGQLVKELASLRELLERRTAELTKANDRLKEQAALLELAHDAVIVRDLRGRVKYWSRGAEEIYGWKRSEAEGRITHELLTTRFPIPLHEIESIVLDKGKWQGELIHYTRKKKPIVVESRWALQRDENGEPIAMLEINRDITARKIAEAAAKDYSTRLERSNRGLRDFASIASHDLQEPLRKVSTFGSILEARFAGALGK